ncbi:MAG: (2Fe-2S)-binding protein [Lentisphaeria bacterium]|nr:(2Fe-2S)-binding protein [Lentisphaeria bacterium]
MNIICYCYYVPEDVIIDAIQEKGCRTIEDLQAVTQACMGCRTCRWELDDLLDKYKHQDDSKKTPS